jgi:hypothetical protein
VSKACQISATVEPRCNSRYESAAQPVIDNALGYNESAEARTIPLFKCCGLYRCDQCEGTEATGGEIFVCVT